MNLSEIKRSYLVAAEFIPGWQTMSSRELADGFLDASEDKFRDSYFAALACRYWNCMYKQHHRNQHSNISLDECYNWLITALLRALYYKAWRDPESKMYSDPRAVDKIVNQCLASVRAGYYQDSNRMKRKANYITESIEQYCDEFGDYYLNLMEGGATYSNLMSACHELIENLMQKGDLLSGVILDEICYQDCFKDGMLSYRKMLKDLHNLTPAYLTYLQSNYNLTEKQIRQVKLIFVSLSSYRLRKLIDKTLNTLKDKKDIISYLCS